MEFRIDIKPTDDGPELVALWLTGWGWLLGGGTGGKHTIHGSLSGRDITSGQLLQSLDEENVRKPRGRLWKSAFSAAAETPQSELEIERTLVLSTSHITEEDSRLLNPDVGCLAIIDSGYGWFIRIPDKDGFEGLAEQLKENGLSACVFALMQLADSHNCNWLHLDSDGPVIDSLPQHHW